LRIGLLGGFSVSVGEHKVDESAWRLRKAASLIKLLSLAPGHRLHRERVMDLLWPESGKKAASNNLRQTLHVARKTLHPDPHITSRYLTLSGEQLLPHGELWVDVDAFEQAAETAAPETLQPTGRPSSSTQVSCCPKCATRSGPRLKGTVEVEADGERYRLDPGEFLSLRPGVVHSLHNPGPGMTRILTLVSPGSQHARFFSTLGQPIDDSSNPPVPDGPGSPRAELGERYGVVWHEELIPEVTARFGLEP
jgi:hypothetical protein